MKNVIVLGVLAVVFTGYEVVTSTQSGQPASPPSVVSLAPPLDHPWGPPQLAFDIPKGDIDTLLKNAPPGVDQMLRVVDMGKYNLGVSVVKRYKTDDRPDQPVSGPYHDYTDEVYIVLSGGGILTTGTPGDRKPGGGYSLLNGPGGSGTPSRDAVSRRMGPGDIVIVPPGVVHIWSHITDQVTYLCVRTDPDRTLPGGYVNPLLLKNQLLKP
jgi:mannose-6-phosphate isomerase-like protein (cupin superfamily)